MVMRNELATVTLTKLTADTEQAIAWEENDERMTLVVVATTATTLTVKAGDGIQGAGDLTLDVGVGTHLLRLDSGRFKVLTGDNKGCIVVKSAGTPSVGAVAQV